MTLVTSGISVIDEKTGKKKTKKVPTKRHGVGKRWIVQYLDLEGNRTSETFSSYEEAEIFDAKVRVGKSDETLIFADKKEVTLGELWEPWLDSKANISENRRRITSPIGTPTWSLHGGRKGLRYSGAPNRCLDRRINLNERNQRGPGSEAPPRLR